MSTNNPTEKVNLTSLAAAHHIAEQKAQKAQAADYVENELLPYLIRKAEAGRHVAIVQPTVEASLSDVIEALLKRVECEAKPTGWRSKIYISW